ncbi:MAG TPA: B12-binding domain-containing radical SAM protein [Methylomirabilota bacterium]|nr:B12-binding domain-containing radical SAM protein [Methylomirabilota bacterium]
MPNILLVYPKFPLSYWGFQFAMDFVGRKACLPPLGLLTVAGMFPRETYTLRVVDMNVEPLTDTHLSWADVVMTSSMIVQQDSLYDVVRRCNSRGIPVVAGGPYPTSYYDDIKQTLGSKQRIDHYLFGEVEETFPLFLEQLARGEAQEVYREPTRPDGKVRKPALSATPPPRYDLVDLEAYHMAAVQFCRGCPWECEWCDITALFGRVTRTKTNAQMLHEFQLLYELGWRGPVLLVDDNFIGNRRNALRLLPDLAQWQQAHDYPFPLCTEASMDLVKHPELLAAMPEAGFNLIFCGIETLSLDALLTMKKQQNTKRTEDGYDEHYLLQAVRHLQAHGIEVAAGFILGADGDTEASFEAHIEFIHTAGIVMAMEGLLTVLKGTALYTRLEREGRLLGASQGNNVSTALNFIPHIDQKALIAGYKRVLSTLYDPTLRNYFERCWIMLQHLSPATYRVRRVGSREVRAFLTTLWRQLPSRQGLAYARFLARVLRHRPRMFPEAVRCAIEGYHFEKVTRQVVAG